MWVRIRFDIKVLGDGFEVNDNQSETQDGTSGLYPLIFAVILIVLEVRL